MVSHTCMTSMCLSVRPSVFFPNDTTDFHQTWYNVCALIWWRSSLGLLMGKLRQVFTLFSLSALK